MHRETECAASRVEELAQIEREHFGDPDNGTGIYAPIAIVKSKRRLLPIWIGRLLCRIRPHRWLVNSSNDWRYCPTCDASETRGRGEVWKS